MIRCMPARLKLDGALQLQFKPGDDNGAMFLDAIGSRRRLPASCSLSEGAAAPPWRVRIRRRAALLVGRRARACQGHVRTERFGNIVWGDEMKLRRADSTGFVDNARYQLRADGGAAAPAKFCSRVKTNTGCRMRASPPAGRRTTGSSIPASWSWITRAMSAWRATVPSNS